MFIVFSIQIIFRHEGDEQSNVGSIHWQLYLNTWVFNDNHCLLLVVTSPVLTESGYNRMEKIWPFQYHSITMVNLWNFLLKFCVLIVQVHVLFKRGRSLFEILLLDNCMLSTVMSVRHKLLKKIKTKNIIFVLNATQIIYFHKLNYFISHFHNVFTELICKIFAKLQMKIFLYITHI